MKTGQIDKTKEPFSVRNKPFFDIHAAQKLCVTASSILSQKKSSVFLDRCALGAHRQKRKHPHDPDTELMPRTAPKRPNRAAPHSGGGPGQCSSVSMWLAERGHSWLQPAPFLPPQRHRHLKSPSYL